MRRNNQALIRPRASQNATLVNCEAILNCASRASGASIDLKRDEPGLIELAEQLALPLMYFSSEQLATYQAQLSHHSDIAFERTGCYGVAESAALALAEQLAQAPAKLLIPRQKYAQATLALASAA